MMGDYPAVEITAGNALVTGRDTLWSDAIGPVALVTRQRPTLGRAWPELSAGVRAHQRIFGDDPVPVTVLLVAPRARRDTAPDARILPALLPDSLARRARVWYAFPGDRRRRGDMAPGAMPDEEVDRAPWRVAPLGPQVAERWLEARAGGTTGGIAPWLHAALVSALGGGVPRGRAPRGLLERREDEVLSLDSLFARRCESGWRPVPLLDLAAGAPAERARRDSARADAVRDRQSAGCGARFQSQASSVLAFMMERAGDPFADVLLRAALRGESVERALADDAARPAGRAGLPGTIRELEIAWRAWMKERSEG